MKEKESCIWRIITAHASSSEYASMPSSLSYLDLTDTKVAAEKARSTIIKRMSHWKTSRVMYVAMRTIGPNSGRSETRRKPDAVHRSIKAREVNAWLE